MSEARPWSNTHHMRQTAGRACGSSPHSSGAGEVTSYRRNELQVVSLVTRKTNRGARPSRPLR